MPRPDFPKSLPDFIKRFSTEEACFDYLLASRWPNKKFKCPGCGHGDAYKRGDQLAVQCAKCAKVTSATAGTVMHGSRQPLCSWLMAAFLMVIDKRGLSAVQLQRALGLKRHEVAYQMLHKLRAAMVAPERSPLRGRIECDATLIGGERRGGGPGTWKGAQQVVMGAVEVVGKHTPGRLRLKHVDDETTVEAEKFLKENVERGSHVSTDAANVYQGLGALGMWRDVQSTAWGMRQDEVLPTLHMVFSNLKKVLLGTYKGAVRAEHLQSYLNEFVFRFNRRGNLHAAFQTLLGIAPNVEGPTYKSLYSGDFHHANPARRRKRA